MDGEADPIGFAGSPTNLYVYVESDPVNLIDVEGTSVRSAISSFGWGVVKGLGAALITGAGLTVAGAIAPAAAVGGLVALAAYGGWQLGMAGQRILGGFDPWSGCDLSGSSE